MDTIYKCSVDEVTMGALVFVFKPVEAIYSYSKFPLMTNLVMNWQLTGLKVR